MILYAKLDPDGYVNSYSDTESGEFNTAFEIDDDSFIAFSACSGRCFTIENGQAVLSRDIDEYITSHRDRVEKLKEIELLKKQLFESDYKAIKYSEGFYTEEEYEPIRQERAAIRERINLLEEGLI